MERRHLSLLPYFPLASGLLTGKYRRNTEAPKGARLSYSAHHSDVMTERNWARLDQLNAVAKRTGHSLPPAARLLLVGSQMALSVLFSSPNVASADTSDQYNLLPLQEAVSVSVERPTSQMNAGLSRTRMRIASPTQPRIGLGSGAQSYQALPSTSSRSISSPGSDQL